MFREADERRQMMLSQILSSQARERSKLPHLKMLWTSSSSSCFVSFFATVTDMMIFHVVVMYHFSIVARIALVKPDKARGVEDVILRAAQMGQIVEKVRIHLPFLVIEFIIRFINVYSVSLTLHECYASDSYCNTLVCFLQVSEERLITLLEQINSQTSKQTKVTVRSHNPPKTKQKALLLV